MNNMTNNNVLTYALAPALVPTAIAAVDQANARAKRCRVPAIEYSVGDALDDQGKVEFRISKPEVRIAGWALAGVVEIDDQGQSQGQGGNVVRPVPGRELPREFRATTPARCDHCHASRGRKVGVILVDEVGRHVQVGRQCCKDFFGHSPAGMLSSLELYASLAELLGSMDDDRFNGEGGGVGRRRFGAEPASVLNTVAWIVRHDGWKPRSTATTFDPATADVYLELTASRKAHGQFASRVGEDGPSADDRKLAGEALAWAQELPADSDSDYLYNLGTVARRLWIEARHVGILASAIASYRRHQERELARAERAATVLNEGFGEVGRRYSKTRKADDRIRLRLEFLREFSSDFGLRCLCKFRDEAGREFVWWSSGYPTYRHEFEAGKFETKVAEVGEWLLVGGTVKAHEVRDGIVQTVLSRCAIEKEGA